MPTPAESGFRHGWSTMPKLGASMTPVIFAMYSIMPQMAKVLQKKISVNPSLKSADMRCA